MPSGPDALDLVDDYHASRGWGLYYAGRVYHIGYHYLITADGHVLDGRPPWLPGAHTRGHNDMLGICLIGCFTADQRGRLRRPRPAQMAALERLVRRLAAAYHIPHARVYLHRDLGQTVCPGDGFPREEFFRALWRHG
jgi:N-acetyl-anhydromuramyl-L-alanine amidase AmpD